MVTTTAASPEPHEPTHGQILDLDIDLRIHALILEAWDLDEWDEALIAGFLRLAYAAGYQDALAERRRGQLCLDHGAAIPKRGSR